MLALDLPTLLAPVTSAVVEETKAMQFCANMLVRGAFTADDGYTQQVCPNTIMHKLISCTAGLWVRMLPLNNSSTLQIGANPAHSSEPEHLDSIVSATAC